MSLNIQARLLEYLNPCALDSIELNDHHNETLIPDQGRGELAACSIAVLTGTSLINGICDEHLAGLGSPRAAEAVLGASPRGTEPCS